MRMEAPDMEVEAVIARLASLAGVIAAATAEQVDLIAGVVASEGWSGPGVVSPGQWVGLRCGVSPGHARRRVAAARGLADLPLVRAALAAGQLTADHVAEIVRAGTTAVHDDQVVELARQASVTSCARACRSCPALRRRPPRPRAGPSPSPRRRPAGTTVEPRYE